MKIKRIICFLLICLLLLSFSFITISYANDLDLKAKSYVLMEPESGKILLTKDEELQTKPASITKIMTILLIYEALEKDKINMDDIVTVSDHAASMGGSQIFLEPYEKQTVEDMLKSIVIASANDASVAMAEHIAGSEGAFVKMMNNKSRKLGMTNTHFVNSCGLDADEHYTCAKDVAIMSRELITRYPQVHKYSTIWQDSITHKTRRGEKEFVLTNTNKLLKWYQGANGLKTGSTNKAKYCLSGTAERNGLKLVGVVMGAPDHKTRFREVMKLFNYGYANYKILKGKEKDSKVGKVKVQKGKKDDIDVYVKKQINFVIKKGEVGELKSNVVVDDHVVAPTVPNTKVGYISYSLNGVEVGKSDLIIKEKVTKANFMEMINKFFRKIF